MTATEQELRAAYQILTDQHQRGIARRSEVATAAADLADYYRYACEDTPPGEEQDRLAHLAVEWHGKAHSWGWED